MPETLDVRAKSIIDRLIDLQGLERFDALEHGCAGDPELRSRVESLLASMEKDDAFLREPTVTDLPPNCGQAASEKPGSRIGPYSLIERIGEGGFGSVYRAEQSQPVRRQVALKIIKLGMDTQQVIARFEAERQALALMEHPNIARVLDAGATDTGRPYFVMELVRGERITRYCDEECLSIQRRLELFLDVCSAVQHAHQKGVIHRDLKPSNVLVTAVDDRAVPKVIDFGVAKATAGRLTDRTLHTELHQLIGTPDYMSPEQADPTSADIDTRSDIYALGVLLFELLTGNTPFDRQRLRSAPLLEMQRILREEEPPRPSFRLAALAESSADVRLRTPAAASDATPPSSVIEIAKCRRTEPMPLTRAIRGDLDWIVLKCLEKDRSRRYDTAAALSDDVRRYLAQQPVTACPPSAAYKLSKFVKRHRTGVLASAVVLLALAGGLGAALYGLGVAREERDTARKEAERANWTSTFMRHMFDGVKRSVHRGRDTTLLLDLLDDASERISSGELKGNPKAEVRLRRTIGQAYNDIARYDDAVKMLEPALAMARELWPGDHADLAFTLSDLGMAHKNAGRLALAEPLVAEALDISRRLYEGDHTDIAGTIHNLATVRFSLGRLAEAEALYEETLSMCERLHAGDHDNTAVSLYKLANARLNLGRVAEAEPLGVRSVEMCRRLYKSDHPNLAASLSILARIRHMSGNSAEAKSLLEEALEIKQRLHPGDHPEVADGISELAEVAQELGNVTDAKTLNEQALEMRQRLFPGDHPSIADSLITLSSIARQSPFRMKEAEQLAVQALDMCRGLHSGDQLSTARALLNLGTVCELQGRSTDADELYQESLEMRQRLLSADHPLIAESLNNLGYVRMMSGRVAEAVPLLTVALEMRKRLYPGDHPSIAMSLNNLAGAEIKAGRPEKAEPLFEDVLAMDRRLYSGDHIHIAMRLGNVAYARELQGRFADAEPLYEEAVAMQERLNLVDHAYTASFLVNLAKVRTALGRDSEAIPLLERSLEIRRRIYKGDHRDIVDSLSQLYGVYHRAGRLDDAEAMARERLAMQQRLLPPRHIERVGAVVSLANVLASRAWSHSGDDAGAGEKAANRAAEAVALLQEAVATYSETLSPTDWNLAYARQILGFALAAVALNDHTLDSEQREAQLKEAESLLIAGHESLVAAASSIPVQTRALFLNHGAGRLIKLYDAWDALSPNTGKSELAAQWRAKQSSASEAKPRTTSTPEMP